MDLDGSRSSDLRHVNISENAMFPPKYLHIDSDLLYVNGAISQKQYMNK